MTQQELELPKGWVETKLDDIAELIGGGTPSRKIPEYFDGDIVWLTPTEIPKNMITVISDSREKITELGLKKSSAKILPKNSVLLTSRASIGYVAISGCNVTTNQGFASFICNDVISNYFLAYWLWGRKNLLESKATGTTFKEISKSKLREIDILLPPLNEQKRIVSKIEELFSKIDSTKKSLEHTKLQLVQYRHSLSKSAFEGKLTEKWREKNKPTPDIQWLDYDKKKSSIMKIYNENLQNLITIPKDWYWLDIKSLSESMKNGIYKQKKFYTEDGIACLRMYNIENWSLVWKKIKRLELTPNEISEYKLEFDDILVNRVNSMELVGKSALIPKNIEECVFESKNIRLRLKTEYIKPQLAHLWLLVASRHYFYNNFQQTTGMASINQIQLGQLPIPFCSMEEQEQIVSQIEQSFILIENSQNIVNSTLQTLETMRMSVLKQAFQGKLVPQDPNDEPVSILLENIKKSQVDLKPKKRRVKNVK